MRTIALQDGADFEGWRLQARVLLQQGVPPEQVSWVTQGEASLLPDEDAAPTARHAVPRIPAELMQLLQSLICHHDPQRYGLAYRLLWRVAQGERQLMELITDPDVLRARNAEKQVRRDSHKMKAFVRFREVLLDGDLLYVAWFEPDHYVVERVAPFFVRRFTGMRWSILTPYRSAHWDGESLQYGAGATKADAPQDDAMEQYWRTYFASIFNPARLKVQMMKSEMPVKYWKNLPEARLIPELIREARPRTLAMVQAAATEPNKRIAAPVAHDAPVPQGSVAELRAEARDCRECALWQPATQTVFGEGPDRATLMIVGEQPGDQEDLAGRPFIGPAGKLLDRALAEAGIDRSAAYVTNVVKHFKFEQRGKLRLHKSPQQLEQLACARWLGAERASVRPRLILCLGATAAKALIAPGFAITAERGRWHSQADGTRLLATVHPSYLLRLQGQAERDKGYAGFVQDLRTVAAELMRIQTDRNDHPL